MRLASKFVAGSAAAATMVALVAGPAFADPPGTTVPRDADVVSVGSNTTEYLFDQLSNEYNSTHKGKTPLWYSWDATNPTTGAIGDTIITKNNCTGIVRPNGSGAGITALDAGAQPSGDSTNYCIDFARSSSARNSSDPPYASGGDAFVALAGDAVDWAARDAASGGTDAPANLSVKELTEIYECTVTNWDKIPGDTNNAAIVPYLPNTSSGTRSFWLLTLGGGTTPITPGSCVSDLPTTQFPGGTLEENEGNNSVFDTPNAIGIYSVGDYIAQAYHSAKCTNTDGDCGFTLNQAPACSPTGTQNEFGCDLTGYLGLGEIAKTDPTTPWPLKTTSTNVHINSKFDLAFQRSLFDVVRYDANTTDHIPGPEAGAPGGINLEQFLAAKTASVKGYVCNSTTAQTEIRDYGFLATWPLSTCGTTN
jgi:ABC-type phosphate transport system substrate-binding protein